MKYYEVIFTLTPCSQDAQDLLSALAAEAGFETFEETPTGLKGYVQQSLFEPTVLDSVLDSFPFETTHITYNVREAEDRDWNEQWEQEGFDPIIVKGEKRANEKESISEIVIHDGRHLPAESSSSLLIEIDAHMAFGTGTHETTRMICATLLNMNLKDQRVLDCGSGTGILGICALKLGAASCLAYDIDEWSTGNTRHNAVINRVDDRLTALCGDSSVLNTSAASPAGFSLVLANINRNILLADLPRFRSVMAPGATLILSGFYESDCALLESKAQQLGLTLIATKTDSDWACMVFSC